MSEEQQLQEQIDDNLPEIPIYDMIILPCPVCNKRPKIKRDGGYESSGFGAWCIIQCKPFLKQPHLRIESGKSTWERAYKYAVQDWNNAVRKMLE